MLMLFFTITRVLTKFIEGRALCIFLFIKVLFICSFLSARPPMIFSKTAEVLVIDDFHPVFTESLTKAGLNVNYRPDFSPETEFGLLKNYSIIAVRSKMNFTSDIVSMLPELKCLARGGAGMDNIDEAFALSRDITLLNAPEGNRDAVAEHTLGLLLSMSKKINSSAAEVRQLQWNREANRGWEIGGKTIGIVGFGNAGSCFAKKLSGLNCKVIAYDKYSEVKSVFASESTFDELLASSDVISFHVPLTAETGHMINSGLISKMKDGVVLINTARGGICKLEDVMNGISSGKIKSFATDVLENENPLNWNDSEKLLMSRMMASNQVIITPHVAGWSAESYLRIAEVLAAKILEYTTNVKNI